MMALFAGDFPLIAWYIAVLVFLEGLLSADNALVLAAHGPASLPPRSPAGAAMGHLGRDRLPGGRGVSLGVLAQVLVLQGRGRRLSPLPRDFSLLVTAALATAASRPGRESKIRAWFRGFWGTVALVTLTDIAFSIDSIVAAVGMADDFPARFGESGKYFIVLTGGVLGIITMRFVVRYFVMLLDRFPGLAEGAYFLVAWIGLETHDQRSLRRREQSLGEGKIHPFHIPEVIFWSVMVLIMVLSFLITPKQSHQETHEASEELDLLDRSGRRFERARKAPEPPT